jgi:DNA repair exonuclease SbcCD nuclease subunit
MSESSSAQIGKKNEEKTEEQRMDELEKDMLLAFAELEKSSSTTPPEPSQLQPDQEHDGSIPADKAIEEGEQRSAFSNHDQEAEHRQKQQQQEELFKATDAEYLTREDLVSAEEVKFHTDSADQHKEAVETMSAEDHDIQDPNPIRGLELPVGRSRT